MTQVTQILQAARNLISKRENWTQDYFARAADGSGVYSQSDNAVCWCSLGALNRVSPPDEGSQAGKQAKVFLREAMGGPIASFNDTHTHEEVIAAWDEAIKLARKDENEAL